MKFSDWKLTHLRVVIPLKYPAQEDKTGHFGVSQTL
jgi:hypothetical protein